MSNKSPIFPMSEEEPNHFSDYGFDPQFDYFQVLEEARKDKRETSSRSIDAALHFDVQKHISKDDSDRTRKSKKRRWWRKALLFFSKRKRTHGHSDYDDCVGAHGGRQPVYITESRSGSSTPCRTTSRPSSGPLAGTMTPTRRKGEVEVEIPYVSLRELDMEPQHRISTSALPIYLVT